MTIGIDFMLWDNNPNTDGHSTVRKNIYTDVFMCYLSDCFWVIYDYVNADTNIERTSEHASVNFQPWMEENRIICGARGCGEKNSFLTLTLDQ